MYQRFFSPPEKSYFLFGPRGTGKSTWLRAYYPHAYWVDLIDPVVFRLFSAAPERLKGVLKEQPETKLVIIDEIQRAPELLNVVHSLIEAKEGYQFILTGSSTRKLKKQGVNLLGGRALLRSMPPFFAAELGKEFDLEKNLRLGMLPIVLDAASPADVLHAYAGVYLKEEVLAEGVVRNVGDFARFLETMSFSQASLINTSNIARECQIARKTVESYVSILEDLLLAFRLQPYHRKAQRAIVNHPKFYFFDVGVFHSVRPQNYYDTPGEYLGAALEGLVAQHIKGWVDAQVNGHQLQFWRTSQGFEVDFVVSGPTCFLAIEIKNGTVVHPGDLKGLQRFKEEYPEAKTLLLHRGHERFQEKDVLCIPVTEFLLQIHPQKHFPEAQKIK